LFSDGGSNVPGGGPGWPGSDVFVPNTVLCGARCAMVLRYWGERGPMPRTAFVEDSGRHQLGGWLRIRRRGGGVPSLNHDSSATPGGGPGCHAHLMTTALSPWSWWPGGATSSQPGEGCLQVVSAGSLTTPGATGEVSSFREGASHHGESRFNFGHIGIGFPAPEQVSDSIPSPGTLRPGSRGCGWAWRRLDAGLAPSAGGGGGGPTTPRRVGGVVRRDGRVAFSSHRHPPRSMISRRLPGPSDNAAPRMPWIHGIEWGHRISI
jgi:hypothetical protein